MADYGGFSEPSSLDEMRGYILMQLGKPLICVEIPDMILDQIVMNAVNWFWKYSAGVGSHKEYIAIKLTTGRTKYKIPNLISVSKVTSSTGDGTINTLFSPMHNLIYRDWVVLGNYPGSCADSQGLALTTFDIAMGYLKDVDNHFGIKYQTRYDSEREVLSVYPEPRINHVILAEVNVKQAPQYLFKDILFRDLCVAMARKWWGNALGKFNVQIPGGGTIASADIYQRGKDEETEIKEQIRLESEPPAFLIG